MRGFDLKRIFGIKRHDRLKSPDDKQMQEQQRVAQEIMQEQQRAADELKRQFMAAILDKRADQTPAVTGSMTKKSPPIKINFKEFSGEPEDWTAWSKGSAIGA